MVAIKCMVDKEAVMGMAVNRLIPATKSCVTCVHAKQHMALFLKESEWEFQEIGNMTFTDLWGLAQTMAIGRYKYIQTFKDGKSHCTVIVFLKDKTDKSII